MFCPTSFTTKSRTQLPLRNWEIEIERERAGDITLNKSLFIYHGLSVLKMQRILVQTERAACAETAFQRQLSSSPPGGFLLRNTQVELVEANVFTFCYQTVPDQVKGITCKTLVGRNCWEKMSSIISGSNRITHHSPTGMTLAPIGLSISKE